MNRFVVLLIRHFYDWETSVSWRGAGMQNQIVYIRPLRLGKHSLSFFFFSRGNFQIQWKTLRVKRRNNNKLHEKKKLINITQIKLRWLRGSVRHIRSCFTMCIWALWILAKIVVNVFSFQLILNNNLHRLWNCSAPWSIQNLGCALMATWYVFFDHTKKNILEFKFSKCVPRLFCYTLFFLSAKIKY